VRDGIGRSILPRLFLMMLASGFVLCAVILSSSESIGLPSDPNPNTPSRENVTCGSPESCFEAAVYPKERLGNALTNDEVLALKLQRLQGVAERFPATLWAKRAGLLSAVLLSESNPAAALPLFRKAQQDFPVLDDYIRLWIGEATLNLGDSKQAAVMFESIPMAVPDSNILTSAAYRAGEAWYQASSCPESLSWFGKAILLSDKEPETAQAYLRQAACQLRENKISEGRESLTELWVRFPYTPEAKEAEGLLATNLGGEQWTADPSQRLLRAQAYLKQAFHAEAIEELKQFLKMEPRTARSSEAKLKIGIAQVRLRQYDQARSTFGELVEEKGTHADEALVWLARIYLRQGEGQKLLNLSRTAAVSRLSAERRGQINLFSGIWLEDHKQYDEAIKRYRLMAKQGEPASQRAEGLWRAGWVYYRTGQYREALDTFRSLADQHDLDFEPQALYWMGRSAELTKDTQAQDYYHRVCQRYPFTYYCQLAYERAPISENQEVLDNSTSTNTPSSSSEEAKQPPLTREDLESQTPYRRAIELKMLGLDDDAAHEVAVLTDRYSRDPKASTILSTLLNEVGAYHHALRLARARFRDQLERTGGALPPELWRVAYPSGLLPTIKRQEAKGVDPNLIAAIIREESQYDVNAVSRVGAIGLMQVMPATANNVARKVGLPAVEREDLFDRETNIRIGVRYVEQLLDQFSGNLVYAIASYNAGPIAVGRWVNQFRGQSEDEFVELIPYQETRYYVKRVLRSYREYVRLNGAS